ncbi:MAG: hypothetical protein HY300_10165 [Verrucomicrobia bacterium]|nr:hypothetical protein [Verrucomicrobiota bacterium]
MIRLVLFVALACVGISACVKKPAPPAPQPQQEPAPAPETEAKPAAPAPDAATPPAAPAPETPPPADAQNKTAAQEPEEPVTPLTLQQVTMLNYAVSKFREENGRLPRSLQEMVGKNLPRMPRTHPSERLVYDPNTGMIKVEKVK